MTPSRLVNSWTWIAPICSSGLSSARRRRGPPPVTALLLEQDPGDVLQQLPRHVRILLRERAEVPEADRVAAHRRQRRDGRRPLALADHRQLAEVVARPDRRDALTVDDHGGLALGDHEERDAAHLALLGEQRAGRDAAVGEVLGELAQLALAEPAEERDALELLRHARHVATLPGRDAGRRERSAARSRQRSAGWRSLTTGMTRSP